MDNTTKELMYFEDVRPDPNLQNAAEREFMELLKVKRKINERVIILTPNYIIRPWHN